MDCSLPGSSVHGIFQARVLEWGAIAFSEKYLGSLKNSWEKKRIEEKSRKGKIAWRDKKDFFSDQYKEIVEGNGTHSSTLAWKIPWMEEPGRLQSMGSLRVGHD